MKAAIFDFDGVFTENSSGQQYREQLAQAGLFKKSSLEQTRQAVANYQQGNLSYEQANKRVGKAWLNGIEGQKYSRYQQEAKKFLQNFDYDRETGQQVIEHFNQEGYRTIIISSSPIEIIKIAAQKLGADKAVAGRSEVENGKYTGRFELDLAAKKSKGQYLKQHLQNVDLAQSYGFGDSPQDANFLKLVAQPIVINPSREMKRIAEEKGWPTHSNLKDYLKVIKA